MEEFQELYCHNCDKYVQFSLDMSLNGNHRIDCPNCDHPHFRVVANGIVTEDRYGGGYIYPTTIIGYTVISTYSSSTSSSDYLYYSWANTTCS